ncbi:Fic family protein [Dongia sedimenti]|uniref:Fic family protein n=1 Tax=Dongia sedimenti TaxID=3064282 RepID=A0ABU0YLR2_9PROT|nr:Fic family protein [Rhodospirillaceae bacterium R-7]
MKAQDFGRTAPGKLVPTIDGAVAFLPDPLPPRRVLDLEPMINLLASASQSLGELAGIGGIMTNPYLLIRPLLRQEAVASSRIEGTITSVRQLALFESGMDVAGDAPDAREVHNYVRALEHGIARLQELPVCLRMMNEMHTILLESVTDRRGARVRAGEVRGEQNWIGGSTRIKDARYVPPPPQEVMPALHAFEKYMQAAEPELPLLVRLALLHYQFEAIHPYPDGNGRLGRLIIPLILCERKALPQPLLYLSSYFERNRDDYIDLMFDVSTDGLWERWIAFFLRGVEAECRATVTKIRRLQDMRQDFMRRVQRARSSVLLGRLIDLFFEHPILFVPTIARDLGISYNAAKNNLKRLAEVGIVKEETFKGRRYWLAQDILAITTNEASET